MSHGRRANYALLRFEAHLGTDEDRLELPWATFCGNATAPEPFEVPTADPVDAYLQIQAYEVGAFGHEIVVNGEPLPGFDLPPADGWQLWMDTLADSSLVEGENAVAVRRDVTTDDSFAVASAAVHWREPGGPTGGEDRQMSERRA